MMSFSKKCPDQKGKASAGVLFPESMALILSFAVCGQNVYAGEGDQALSIVRSSSSGTVGQRVAAVGKQIEQIFGSVYNMLATVGVCIAVVGLIIAFVELGLSKQGRLRETAKWKLVGIAGALILIGGATTFVNLFLQLL